MIRKIPNQLFECCRKQNIGLQKHFVRNLYASSANLQKFETAKFCRYSPEEGHIRLSPFENITSPNLTLDQYVWKNYKKWQDKTAIVSIFKCLDSK